ncbi:oxalate:formate antiporter [Echinococcus granulosus]|uniref:Oxalate:formate antiporter n=1 Tax=Echinococcus granulosus TaxID=6210 RepID=W6U427_ECHGR|nr:oxalate:formate antiporter [Echinococcus granulosus]EUB55863.1 oxalate:formate antiporter [Echinococcus granulosus]
MRHGYYALLGGFLIMFSLGQMYTLGEYRYVIKAVMFLNSENQKSFLTPANMAPYIVSFLHEYVDANISPGFAISLSTGAVAAFGITLPLSGIFWSKVGIMRFVFVACLLNSASVFFSAFTIRVNAILFFFTYSILAGIAVGCGYGLVLQVALSWFPKKHGLVVGICTVGFGGGVTLLLPIQTILINPNNTSPNATTDMFEDVNMLNRIPPCLQITGALITGLEVVGCCFFRQRPSADSEMDEEETVAQTPIPDDRFLMVVSITGAVFNIMGRFFWGYIADKVSFKIPMILVNAVYAAALISLPRILWLPGAGRVCYAIWVPLLFLCLAGNFVLLTFGITRSMGPKHVASIYGAIFLASVPASLLGAGIFSQIDVRNCFNEIFLANGIIALSVSIFAIFLRDDQIPHWPRWLPCNLDRTKSPLFSPSTTPTEVCL